MSSCDGWLVDGHAGRRPLPAHPDASRPQTRTAPAAARLAVGFISTWVFMWTWLPRSCAIPPRRRDRSYLARRHGGRSTARLCAARAGQRSPSWWDCWPLRWSRRAMEPGEQVNLSSIRHLGSAVTAAFILCTEFLSALSCMICISPWIAREIVRRGKP